MWVCPNSEEHKTFSATAHVTQDWVIDENNAFVETTHSPDKDDLVTCHVCHAEAVWVD